MFDEIANIVIISPKPEHKQIVPKQKYTKSEALRNVYKAKVSNINKKRGK